MMDLFWKLLWWSVFVVLLFLLMGGLQVIQTSGVGFTMFLMMLAIGGMMMLSKTVFDENPKPILMTIGIVGAMGLFIKYGYGEIAPYWEMYLGDYLPQEATYFDGFYRTWLAWTYFIGWPIMGYWFKKNA